MAHQWLQQRFEPVVEAVPADLRSKLEPAELYHEVLEHRWFASEQAGHEIPMLDAAASYVRSVLQNLPDERVEVPGSAELSQLRDPYDPSQGYVDDGADEDDEDKPYDPWEDDDLGPQAEDPAASGYLDIEALRRKAKG